MKKTIITLALGLLVIGATAQNGGLDLAKKQIHALRMEGNIRIDGVLSEEIWQTAPSATGFVQLEPVAGNAPSQKTEVKVIYDNTGIYIGAILHDTHPDSILQELTQRDRFGNTDWFGIFIDPYRDGINGVGFIVTPAGVQFDAKYSAFGEDDTWDAVWESAAQINPQGWVAEVKIPYSAIRFPEVPEQIWHINFGRLIRRYQEKNFWSEINPQVNGLLNQSGYLTGIREIKSPFRLQATPFVAVYGEHFHDKNAETKNSFGRSFNAGMDIKYGINDAFTLDMTLIPDFGEARSDNEVLNLSPFEVRFDENRQFFTEGIELFNKGDLFYSRRIGGRPIHRSRVSDQLQDGEEIVDNPQQSQLYNATKISGRNTKGLGIGFFNATSGRTTATVRNGDGVEREIETDPLTNYNVLVLDQNLKYNSYFTLVNTTVLRSGPAYDANVSAAVFQLRNKANAYAVEGNVKVSQKYFTEDTDLGHAYNLTLRKISGNLTGGVSYNEESDTYDPNDLGFLFNNNERNVEAWVNYGFYKPFWHFNRGEIGLWTNYQRLYNPDAFTEAGVNFWGWGQLKNFWEVNVWGFVQPVETFDFFEPREPGRYFRNPTFGNIGFWIGSDGRKRVRVSVNANFSRFNEEGRWRWNWNLSPRFRVNDKLNLQWQVFNSNSFNNIGFVDNPTHTIIDENTGAEIEQKDIIFGKRDFITVENLLNVNYTFNNAMGLTFRMRHNWSKVKYNSFHLLQEDGRLGTTDYNENNDTNFNAFNIDMIYRWRFAPGSDIFIIWKNSILSSNDQAHLNYFRNLDGLFDNPQTNSLSLKVIYFLDYVNVVKNKR